MYGRPRTVVADTIAIAHNGQPAQRATAAASSTATTAEPDPWKDPIEPVAEVARLAQCYLMPAPLHPKDVRRPPLAPGPVLLQHLLQYTAFLPFGWLKKYGLEHDPDRDHGLVYGDPSAGSQQRGILGGKGRRCCLALKYGRRVFYPIESAYVWDTFYELIIAFQARAKRVVDTSRWNSWTFAHLLPFLRYAAKSDSQKLGHLRAAKHTKHLAGE